MDRQNFQNDSEVGIMGEIEGTAGGLATIVTWGFGFILIWGLTQPFMGMLQDGIISIRHGGKTQGGI
jgi:hypothetical protein